MTPDEAQHAIRDAEYIGANLPGECWRALDTISGMCEEWRVEFQAVDDRKWYPLTEWAEGEPDRRPWNVTPTRISRRYVTGPEDRNATN